MGLVGANRKTPNDAPLETLSLRLSRAIAAPQLSCHGDMKKTWSAI